MICRDHHCGLIGYHVTRKTRVPISSLETPRGDLNITRDEPLIMSKSSNLVPNPVFNISAGLPAQNTQSSSRLRGRFRWNCYVMVVQAITRLWCLLCFQLQILKECKMIFCWRLGGVEDRQGKDPMLQVLGTTWKFRWSWNLSILHRSDFDIRKG